MILDTASWRGFKINDLFSRFERGKANQTKLEDGDDTFYVGAKRDDNGVMLRCAYDKTLISEGNCIVFICNGQGSVGFANYMDRDFVASTDLVLGYADWLNADVGMFLATVFSLERPKYSFGRKWGRFLKDTIVQLPVESDASGNPTIDPDSPYNSEGYVPDWQFMEDFIKSLNHKPLTTENRVGAAAELDTAELVGFNFGRLVSDVYKATAFTKDDLIEVPYTDIKTGGYIRYITRTALDNGCEMLVAREKDLEDDVEAGNAISIGDTTATCFYQSEDFVAGDHMVVVRAEWLNPFTGNFIATLLNRESYRYSYGRAFVMESIKATDLKLPIKRNPDGTPVIDPKKSFHDDGYIPDWQFMEDYMRSLPYGDRIPEAGD